MTRTRAAVVAASRFRGAAFVCVAIGSWVWGVWTPCAAIAQPGRLLLQAPPAFTTALADTLAVPEPTDSTRPPPVDTAQVASPEPPPAMMTMFRPDSAHWHVELGTSADYTNEFFYEDAFIDTTFLGRTRIEDPEARIAGVLFASLDGTRGAGQTRYQFQNEWSVGNLLQRGSLGMNWRTDVSPEWRVVATPSVEFRRDQTYGRDLREWRAQVSGRARRTLLESATAIDLMASADLLRTDGTGADFVLDRNAARVGVALDHGALSTFGARVGYALVVRQFPDSSERSHLEHQTELRLRQDRDRGLSWAVDGTLFRRVTLELAPTSRDNWWQELSVLDGEWREGGVWSLRSRAELDAIQYDVQDSVAFFDYSTLRVLCGPRLSRTAQISLWLAPRLEWLRAPLAPGEGYREFAGQVEFEFVSAGSLISATPVYGHREYQQDPAALLEENGSLHDSYSFLELTFFFDQALPGAWRMRALGTARSDLHVNASENATSLYFSFDVRRLF